VPVFPSEKGHTLPGRQPLFKSSPGSSGRAQLRGVLHNAVRASTHLNHAALDSLIVGFDFADREAYGSFLHVHHAALQTLEPCWRPEDRADFDAMADSVVKDLATLGITQGTIDPVGIGQMSEPGRFGVGYVIRGSRMGSALLKKRVPSRWPSGYLDLQPKIAWAQFLRSLDQLSPLPDPEIEAEVILGARCAFDVFSESAKIMLGNLRRQ